MIAPISQPSETLTDDEKDVEFVHASSATAVADAPKSTFAHSNPACNVFETIPAKSPTYSKVRPVPRKRHWFRNTLLLLLFSVIVAAGGEAYFEYASQIAPEPFTALPPTPVPPPTNTVPPVLAPSDSTAHPAAAKTLATATHTPEVIFAAEAFLSGNAPLKILSPELDPPALQPATVAEAPALAAMPALPPVPVRPRPEKADNVVDFQPYRVRTSITNSNGDEIGLTNLNPLAGVWYVLDMKIGGQTTNAHLEAAALRGQPAERPKLALYRDGLEVTQPGQPAKQYPLWPASGSAAAELASLAPNELNPAPQPVQAFLDDDKTSAPYYPICDGLVLVRKQRGGSMSRLEYATDLLRTSKMGSWFVEAAKPYLIAPPELGEEHREATSGNEQPVETAPPRSADVAIKKQDLNCKSPKLGIKTDAPEDKYYYGKWYQATGNPHVFAGMMKPTAAPEEMLASYSDRVGPIGMHDRANKEADALVYLVAFDLEHFRFGYSLGADQPKVEWSTRAAKTPGGGPDGFGNVKPLSTVGALPPYYLPYVAATFVGGFKREHGAFRANDFAKGKNGNHFGFEEAGVVCSALQPGLATVAITRDGDIDLLTWPEKADELSNRYLWIRQNCAPIIEGIDDQGASIPGRFVNNWRGGEWSGDQNGNVVTLRSGVAIQEYQGRRFLIFTYFTGASPNAMARVFQAYHCRFAMLLDMNTPNYCYFSLYRRDPQGLIAEAEYLHKDMASGNGKDGCLKFLQKNDTRDFFYVLNRQ